MKIKFVILMAVTLMSGAIYAQDSKPNRLALSTGFGTPNRFSDYATVKLPIHLSYERAGAFNLLPEYIYVGGYVRYAKIDYEFTAIYGINITYNYNLIGFGGRATVDIARAIDVLSGSEVMPKFLALYGGAQIGYDIITISDDDYESNSMESEGRIEPFVGAGVNLGQTFGLHVEFGNTSAAIVTLGANLKF